MVTIIIAVALMYQLGDYRDLENLTTCVSGYTGDVLMRLRLLKTHSLRRTGLACIGIHVSIALAEIRITSPVPLCLYANVNVNKTLVVIKSLSLIYIYV